MRSPDSSLQVQSLAKSGHFIAEKCCNMRSSVWEDGRQWLHHVILSSPSLHTPPPSPAPGEVEIVRASWGGWRWRRVMCGECLLGCDWWPGRPSYYQLYSALVHTSSQSPGTDQTNPPPWHWDPRPSWVQLLSKQTVCQNWEEKPIDNQYLILQLLLWATFRSHVNCKHQSPSWPCPRTGWWSSPSSTGTKGSATSQTSSSSQVRLSALLTA